MAEALVRQRLAPFAISSFVLLGGNAMAGVDHPQVLAGSTLQTLGTLHLTHSALTRPKPLLLLAFLAHEGPTDRERLARLFFPNTLDARDALSTTIRRLAGLVGTVSKTDVRLVSRVTTDAIEFQELALSGEPRAAIDRYQGPFLQGAAVQLEPELEEWVFTTRERLAVMARDLHLALAREGLRRRHQSSAWLHARAAARLTETLALDPQDAGVLTAIGAEQLRSTGRVQRQGAGSVRVRHRRPRRQRQLGRHP